MTGRAKESVFSILGDRVVGASVLDLYAGSGSLGLEALSRGASNAVFVERSARAAAVLRRNIDAVGLGGSVVVADAARALRGLDGVYDIVFVDPPYDEVDGRVATTLAVLDHVLDPHGIVIVHRRAGGGAVGPEFLTSVDERRYGDAVVTMFERTEP
jgi:16S rRNA (guanine966-N2)-methyltransferase